MNVSISDEIKKMLPLKIGLITYNNITIGETPQWIHGRIDLFQEELTLALEGKSVTAIQGVKEWREIFKIIGTDPSRYRPSHEALFRRIIKGQKLPSIHSGADMNNLFSMKYEIPMGIYDLMHINGPVTVRVGGESDTYEGINGREMNMSGKLLTSDHDGAFGSPIVDSKRTMVTETTTRALQVLYLKPSLTDEQQLDIVKTVAEGFIKVNGGDADYQIID